MNVVILDDNQINVTLMEHLVRKLDGCRSVPFLDPDAALAWCRDHEPDLVVVDYMMPGMDGIQFLERLRSQPGKDEVPVLMITASTERDVRYQALDFAFSDFLNKPVDRTEFLSRSRNMLALRSSRRQLADRAEWLAAEVRKATREILDRERETIVRLSKAAEFRDPETGAHILRMAHYSRLIARKLGLPADQQQLILDAAPMHDVGKLGTPDHILLKPGKLTPDEFEIMKHHAEHGFQILKGSSSAVLQAAAEIARTHHEKFDGSGYPRGLKGEFIPLFGRIVAVADVFDALTSERPYKPAWPVERARELIEGGAGQHFDPACVAAFLGAWDDVMAIKDRYRDED